MRHPRPYLLVLGIVVALLALTTAFAAPAVPPQQANPTLTQQVREALEAGTREAEAAQFQATRDQLATEAVRTLTPAGDDFEATTEALQGRVGGTATAVTESVLGTATPSPSPSPTVPVTPTFAATLNPTEIRGTQVVVTAAGAATAQALPLETAQATADAAALALVDGVQTLDAAQLAALLAYAADNGGLRVDDGAGAVVVTYYLQAPTLTAYTDASLFIAGYPPVNLQVTVTADGLVITADEIIVGEVAGPLATTAAITVVDGRAALAVGDVTVGGEPLAPEVAALLASQINAALTAAVTNNLLFDYLVDDAFITGDAVVVTLVIPFAFPAG